MMMQPLPTKAPDVASATRQLEVITTITQQLQSWIEVRDYAGHEPYDILNAPLLSSRWLRKSLLTVALIQAGKRWGGHRLRRLLRVPASKNPKALALVLSGYCDRTHLGESDRVRTDYLKAELRRLRSPGEETFCWGYDWDVRLLRNTVLPAFSPNAVATVFAGQALLDLAELANDEEAAEMARSAGKFFVSRLNRTVNTPQALCFSYTPGDTGRVYNSSALAAAFLARLEVRLGFPGGLELSRRVMQYLAGQQAEDGSWFYGAGRMQRWIDNFHTGYMLDALLEYQNLTGDCSFDAAICKGHNYYSRFFFDHDGAPKYFHNCRYPIDIHCCAQAILTSCAFADRDSQSLQNASNVADWTFRNMRGEDGAFYYQKHRIRLNRSTYMRWGQAWMFRALSRLLRVLSRQAAQTPSQGFDTKALYATALHA